MDTTSDNRKGKALKVAGIVALALVLALSGTFAWTSFSQQTTNEFKSTVNPGARLHDDFSWTDAKKNKDVYVENFTDESSGGVNVYARVKLVEYLEVGSGAGDPAPADPTAITHYPTGATITDHTNWATHKFSDDHQVNTNEFHKYFTWSYGGQTVYMPTFNKNKDSLAVDVNGSYQDRDTTGVQNPYCKYQEYSVDDPKPDTAYYDADPDTIDEAASMPGVAPGAGGTLGTNYTSQSETHKAATTLSAELVSMTEWNNKSADAKKTSNCWVYDDSATGDGWAYWSQAIEPSTATGPLLDNVSLIGEFGNDWYYAIDAIGEFVTFGEWNEKTNGSTTTYYFDAAQTKAIDEKVYTLLQEAADRAEDTTPVTNYSVAVAPATSSVNKGGTAAFTATVTKDGAPATGETVQWDVVGKTSDDTTIAADATNSTKATLTVAAGETASTLTVVAKCQGASGTATVTVNEAPAIPANLQPFKAADTVKDNAANAVVTFNGKQYVKLAEEGDKVMVMPKNCVDDWGTSGQGMFDADSPNWAASDALKWCDSYYKGDKIDAELKSHIVDTTYKTRKALNSEEFDTVTSKVFFLSEADIFGTYNNDASKVKADDYTYNGQALMSGTDTNVVDLRKATLSNGTSVWWWLRSPRYDSNGVAGVFLDGGSGYAGDNNTRGAARPAFWLNLAS